MKATIVFILSLVVMQLHAQDQYYFGLKGGIGFSTEKGYANGNEYHSAYDVPKDNFNGGFELNIVINKVLSFESEIIFEDKGDKFKEQTVRYLDIQYLTRGYLQFPELIRYTFNIKGDNAIKPFVEAGFYFAARLFTSKTEWGINYSGSANASDNELLKRFDWGATGGVGVIKKAGRGFASVDIRFDNSLINLVTNPYPTATVNLLPINLQNNSFKESLFFSVLSFGINYTYPLKRVKDQRVRHK